MRVGVYVDGFNLYYGARSLAGRGTPGWRWLDLRALAADLVGRRSSWPDAEVSRVVYCTARIDAVSNPSGQADQDVYLKALVAAGSVVTSSTARTSPGSRPRRWRSGAPRTGRSRVSRFTGGAIPVADSLNSV